MRIAVDIMSGESSPQELIEGCINAVEDFDIPIAIVGNESLIHRELAKYNYFPDRVIVVPADEVIGMGETPARACKKKPNASILVALKQVQKGSCAAVFSPGNTGATVAAALMYSEMFGGMKRPALAVNIPKPNHKSTLLLDCGANVDVNTEMLINFALLGESYAQHFLNLPSPRIGLLNVGRERSKGNKLARETLKKMDNLEINFVGNVEGNDVFSDYIDVCVTDGFTGNIVLKMCEGISGFMLRSIEHSLLENLKYGLKMMKNNVLNSLEVVKNRFSSSFYGGAPLLGLRSTVVVGHGISDALAIKHGIHHTFELARKDMGKYFERNLNKAPKRFHI